MAKIKATQLAATQDAVYVLDVDGNLWAYNQSAEWKQIELPDQLPV